MSHLCRAPMSCTRSVTLLVLVVLAGLPLVEVVCQVRCAATDPFTTATHQHHPAVEHGMHDHMSMEHGSGNAAGTFLSPTELICGSASDAVPSLAAMPRIDRAQPLPLHAAATIGRMSVESPRPWSFAQAADPPLAGPLSHTSAVLRI